MKNKILLLLSISVLFTVALFFLNCKGDVSFNKPKLIQFEKQEVLKEYNWSLISLNGKSFNLIIKKGNVIVVKYFSLSNEESKEELKVFNEIYKEYKTKIDFIVIVEDNQLEVRNFLQEKKYLFPVCYSLSPQPFKFEPQDKSFRSLIVSRKGRIVMDNYEPINWDSKEIREILNGLTR